MAKEIEDHWTREEAEQCWGRVRTRLCAEVGEAIFHRFIEPMSLESAERGRIRHGIGSRFLRNFIDANFADQLHRQWQLEEPAIVAVDIVVSANTQSGAPPAIPARDTKGPAAPGLGLGAPRNEPRQPPQTEPGGSGLPSQAPQGGHQTGLLPAFTFENFVVGPTNALAHAAARHVAEQPGTRYNPLFIHGPTGVGKTHLEHAIGNAILARRPGARIRYLSAERFLYRFVGAVRSNAMLAFKEEYRSADVLLIDDFQFIAGTNKEATQNEFFHTLNTLIAENRQVVISADDAPGSLNGLDESMRSRLGGGMTVDVGETDCALRLGILNALVRQFEITQAEAKRNPVVFAPDVLPFMAERLVTDGRNLTGAFNRVSGQADFEGVPVTIDFVRKTLREKLQESDRPITIDDITHAVSEHTGIPVPEMKSQRRTQDVVRARHMAWWLCRKLTDRSFPQIAAKFKKKDHTTVLSGDRRITQLSERDPHLKAELEALIKILKK